MAAKGASRFDTHFHDILENIDVKLIATSLAASGIILSDEKDKLEEKSKKSVKFMLKKVKHHDNGDLLFKQCLTETSESQGHQKLLLILYNPENSNSGIAIQYNLIKLSKD